MLVLESSNFVMSISLSKQEMERLLLGLESDKCAGPDMIPLVFLKIEKIFSDSLYQGVFPIMAWKLSHVYPIYKLRKKMNIANH